ncbi:uncharacterized protein [Nerophis lumbriciformis]|uniref:uncharacterized protein n=1 Tax=Nerophis lumbriciformis TaxID=546530 RepID=UPI002ADFF930|nr:uncharacterized protein LOC133614825 [Nerophis lumbriciformis]XP_061829091.1 uncharacterized protein LOC133614825 [Nerophis lumbriciformis]
MSSNTPHNAHHDRSGMSDVIRYFARRELVTTCMTQFNDQPESYSAWQQSFQNAVRGLHLTCSEEMDLLVKWLGKESGEHAKRIRAVNTSQPQRGLQMIWDRLDACYGAPEVVEEALFQRISNFPKITYKDYAKLHELSDLLMELQAAKTDGTLPGLHYLDTARGISPLVHKLPSSLQEKWLSVGSDYKERCRVSFPPFEVFVDFIFHQAKIRNDPSFNFAVQADIAMTDKTFRTTKPKEISVHKMDVSPTEHSDEAENPERHCPIHKKPHLLRKCRAFRDKPIEERKAFLREHKICFKCCTSSKHMARDCKYTATCTECGSEKHNSALHPGPAPQTEEPYPSSKHGGEPTSSEVASSCTTVCGGDQSDRSCSKICLVKIYPVNRQEKAIKVYAIIDEHSNRSLARSEFFDTFKVQGSPSPYSLRTCSGVTETMGRRATGYQIESMDGKVSLPLPSLVECNDIPNNRSEIPTPNAASNHPHLKSIAQFIPELEQSTPILLLLGRDIIAAHKVRKQLNGPRDAPYAQKLDLGWVIVGNVCLGGVYKPDSVNAFYTQTAECKRPSIFQPCPNTLQVKERCSQFQYKDYPKIQTTGIPTCSREAEELGSTVFQQTRDDDKVSPSIEDISFLKIMRNNLKKDKNNSWVAPLPFKSLRRRLPDNKLRGPHQTQKMADLPEDRLSTEPPFTNVGLDVFGPWAVSSRRTRGGFAQSKRWAVLFTCMSVRAVHIEVIESLDTSSFINALRRFLAVRGPVKLIRSDRGTNFVSACKELKISSNIINASVEKYLLDQGCEWKFNAPHASHMGGSWERMIGVARRILDSMFLQLGASRLTHEALTTLMAEVAAIINARPLIPVSTDPDDPLILTPATLLTQKVSIPSAPVGDWIKDLHKSQWRQVQHLAQTFWSRWKKQYLASLQPRRKWMASTPDLQLGSIVLLKDNQLARNEWPLGLITQVFPSKDGKVRQVEIKVYRKDGTKLFLRPISETVLLLAPD